MNDENAVFIKTRKKLMAWARATQGLRSHKTKLVAQQSRKNRYLTCWIDPEELSTLIYRFEGRLETFIVESVRSPGSNWSFVLTALERCTILSEIELSSECFPLGDLITPLLLRPGNSLRCTMIKTPDSWQQTDISQFIGACTASTTLQQLSIFSRYETPMTIKTLGNLIRQNLALESLLVMAYDRTNGPKDSDYSKALIELADDVQHSSRSLKRFHLQVPGGSYNRNYAKEVQSFRNALECNYTLTELYIYPWKEENEYEEKVSGKYLGTKETMRRIRKSVSDPWLPAGLRTEVEQYIVNLNDIYFFLALNNAGRDKLLSPSKVPKTKDWIEAMASQKDPSVIYYVLQQIPSLCDPKAFNNDALRKKRTGKHKTISATSPRKRTAARS